MDKQQINLVIAGLKAQSDVAVAARTQLKQQIQTEQAAIQSKLTQESQLSIDIKNMQIVMELLRKLRDGEEILLDEE